MKNEEIVSHWFASAQEDKNAASAMFDSGHYHWCLFLWHLTLEKLFKAVLTKNDAEIPFTHNLILLAKVIKLNYSSAGEKELKEINTFNLEARYDDYKQSFYKKATKDYATQWVGVCEKWFDTIKEYL